MHDTVPCSPRLFLPVHFTLLPESESSCHQVASDLDPAQEVPELANISASMANEFCGNSPLSFDLLG